MPKRKERVAPPPRTGGWDCRFYTSESVKGWDQLSAVAPDNMREAWERLTANPRARNDRQYRLQADLGSRSIEGRALDQWQYKPTSSGRIWYCIDDEARVLWLTKVCIARLYHGLGAL